MSDPEVAGIIDSSALIALHRERYARDVFSRLWVDIEHAARKRTLVTVNAVVDEIRVENSKSERPTEEYRLRKALFDWVKQHFATVEELFPNKLVEMYALAGELSRLHRGWVVTSAIADPYLIAAGQSLGCPVISDEQTSHTIEELNVIVNRDGGYPRGARIPSVCAFRGVDHLNLLEFFRLQGWNY